MAFFDAGGAEPREGPQPHAMGGLWGAIERMLTAANKQQHAAPAPVTVNDLATQTNFGYAGESGPPYAPEIVSHGRRLQWEPYVLSLGAAQSGAIVASEKPEYWLVKIKLPQAATDGIGVRAGAEAASTNGVAWLSSTDRATLTIPGLSDRLAVRAEGAAALVVVAIAVSGWPCQLG